MLERLEVSLTRRESYHVTLLRPPVMTVSGKLSFSSLVPPLSLAYLSGIMREYGFSITPIDALGDGIEEIHPIPGKTGFSYQGQSIAEIVDRIPRDTKVLGVSTMFSSEWTFIRDMIKQLKKHLQETVFVVGGEHVTAVPDYVLNDCEEIDIIVLGEGEETLIDLVACLESEGDLNAVNGIIYRKNGEFFKTEKRRRIRKVDEIPWPAWDLVRVESYLDKMLSHGPGRGRTMPILASRGCPYDCAFCSNKAMYTRAWIPRSVTDVVNEIKYYIDKYDIQCIEFYDLTPIIKKTWIVEFCHQLIDQNIKIDWQISGGTRTEAIDEEVIVLSKKAGCTYLGFAPESGSQEVLKKIRKQLNLPRMLSLLEIAKKHNVGTRTNFIIGFPFDTRKQIYETLFLQIKLAFLGVLDAPVFEFSPYPGSEYFRLLTQKGTIQLCDEYFDSLGQNIPLRKKKRYCKNVGPIELYIYQFFGMSSFYGIYYLIRPLKFLRFIKNIFGVNISNSVFEQRIAQGFKRVLLNLSKSSEKVAVKKLT